MNIAETRSYFAKAERDGKLGHSYLIISKNIEKDAIVAMARELIGTEAPSTPDLIVNDSGETIKIEEIRELQKVLALKPYDAKRKAIVLFEAQRLSLDAANAFLKTLEEPPEHSILLLTSSQPKALLPTILSRCLTIRLQSAPVPEEPNQDLAKLRSQSLAERLAFAENLSKDEEKAQKLLGNWREMIGNENLSAAKKEKILYYTDKALRAISRGTSPRLALDLLVINLS